MIKAECLWGEGPDIGLKFEDHVFVLGERITMETDGHQCLVHGFARSGWADLTAKEALHLAGELVSAASHAIDQDLGYRDYCIDLLKRREDAIVPGEPE